MPNTPAGSNQLDGVVCTSGTRCTAVGHTVTAEDAPLRTLVETLSAGTWLVVPSPNRGNASSELFGIDCNDATHCIAVGAADSSAPLVEQLSGSTWKLMTTPARDGFSTLNGVDCVSSSLCVAVGYSSGGPASNAARTLVLRSS
jgi:hypothetical protein